MLEETFAVSLLRRTAQGAEPTPEGQRLAAGLRRGFDGIQSSVDQIKPGPLTLACSLSIVMYWVLPRLSRFQQKNPEVLLQYHMTSGPLDFTHDKISVAIRLSSQEPPWDVIRTHICSELVGPVCSPEDAEDTHGRRSAAGPADQLSCAQLQYAGRKTKFVFLSCTNSHNCVPGCAKLAGDLRNRRTFGQ